MYKDVKQVILNIPKFVCLPSNKVDISLALDMYDRFYKPIEGFNAEDGEDFPSLSLIQNAVDYITAIYRQDILDIMLPCLDHVSDLLFYRLLFRLNEQTREIIKKEETEEDSENNEGTDGTPGDEEDEEDSENNEGTDGTPGDEEDEEEVIEKTDGDYHDILEMVKNRYSEIYGFLGIDITFDEIALL